MRLKSCLLYKVNLSCLCFFYIEPLSFTYVQSELLSKSNPITVSQTHASHPAVNHHFADLPGKDIPCQIFYFYPLVVSKL